MWFIKITSAVNENNERINKQTHITIYSKNLILKHTNKQATTNREKEKQKQKILKLQVNHTDIHFKQKENEASNV